MYVKIPKKGILLICWKIGFALYPSENRMKFDSHGDGHGANLYCFLKPSLPFQRQNYIILVEFCKPKVPLKKRGFFIGISFRNAKSLLTCTQ